MTFLATLDDDLHQEIACPRPSLMSLLLGRRMVLAAASPIYWDRSDRALASFYYHFSSPEGHASLLWAGFSFHPTWGEARPP